MCLYIFTETSSCSYKIPIKEHGCSYVLDLRKKNQQWLINLVIRRLSVEWLCRQELWVMTFQQI